MTTHPIRTCIGCRGRAGRDQLLRLVWDPAQRRPVLDRTRTAPGRGANIHPDPACWDLAVRRRAIARALRIDAVAAESVWAAAEAAGLGRAGLGATEQGA